MLEHVEDPAACIAEAARVVRPGGVVLFNTFNQTPLAWLVAVHGFKFVVRDAPEHIHVWRLFIPPSGDPRRDGRADRADGRGDRGRPPPARRRVLALHPAAAASTPTSAFTTTASPAVGYIGAAVRL